MLRDGVRREKSEGPGDIRLGPIPDGNNKLPEPDILLTLSILSPYPTGDSVPCLWKPGLAPGPALYLLVGVADMSRLVWSVLSWCLSDKSPV